MSENNNPWGQGPNNDKDPEEFIKEGIQKIKDAFFPSKNQNEENGGGGSNNNMNGGGNNSGNTNKNNKPLPVGLIILIVFAVFLGYKSMYQVEPGEKAVVLEFGKYSHTAGPGLNFAIPFINSVYKVNIELIQKEEFGFRSQQLQGFNRNSRVLDIESLMLTADKNVVNINWVVQYNISNPEFYLFNINDVIGTIRNISETVIRQLVGNRDFDYVLDNREELALSTKIKMQEILDKYKSGIRLQTVQLQDVTPPEPVRPSFNEVNEADQDKTRLVNEAQREYNNQVPKASGEAKRLIQEAEGYAIRRINDAKGEASRFEDIYAEYRKYRTVTKQRLYLEAMKDVLPNVNEVLIVDKNKNVVPLINFSGSGNPLNTDLTKMNTNLTK